MVNRLSEEEISGDPQYAGDDTRPTSRKELAGWYSYGWAAEVFAVCAMGTLEFRHFPLLYFIVFFFFFLALRLMALCSQRVLSTNYTRTNGSRSWSSAVR